MSFCCIFKATCVINMLFKWLLQCVKVGPLDGKKYRQRRAVSERRKERFTTYVFLVTVLVHCSWLLLWKLPGSFRTRRSLEHWTRLDDLCVGHYLVLSGYPQPFIDCVCNNLAERIQRKVEKHYLSLRSLRSCPGFQNYIYPK
jgi:hypothetical protein